MIAVTGASSFIGQHLVSDLSERSDTEVRVLIHKNRPKAVRGGGNIVPIEGDLLNPDTLPALFEPDCTVINLAYLHGMSIRENMDAMENLAQNCMTSRIRRMVHCSTAVVVGGVSDDVVTEEMPCDPKNEYETTKLQIEELLKTKARGHFEVAILRPTAVFGPGGKNLLKLAGDLTRGNTFINYLKSCLYSSRRMNLVYVDNVVSAILFLAFTTLKINGETFIISDDEYPENNYRAVEKQLARLLGRKDHPLPRVPLSKPLLSGLLKLAGRSNNNPNRVYSSKKIRNMGFQEKTSFEAGLSSFAEWYKKTHLPPKQKE